MGKILTYIVIASALLCCMLSGCNSTGCTENQSSIPLAGLYDSSTGRQASFTGLEVRGIGAPNDSILYDGKGAVNELYLPLRPSLDMTSYCIHYTQEELDSDEYNDTITMRYDALPYFASEQCGAMWQFRINSLTTTHHLIDSVVVTDPLITNIDIERIKIYFKTGT